MSTWPEQETREQVRFFFWDSNGIQLTLVGFNMIYSDLIWFNMVEFDLIWINMV